MSEDNFFSEFARVATVLEAEDTPSLVSGTYSTPRGDDRGVVDMFGTSGSDYEGTRSRVVVGTLPVSRERSIRIQK